MITDLIYDDSALPEIREEFPGVEVEDARDMVHDLRIQVKIDCTEEEWWIFLMKSGVGQVSLNFQLNMHIPESAKKMKAVFVKAGLMKAT